MRPLFFLKSLKNKFKPVGWWISSRNHLNDYFSSISSCDYVLFGSLNVTSTIEYNRDIDILFKIEEFSQITYKLKRGRPTVNAIRVNLYSLEGAYPFNYNGIAYFPPKLGKAFLKKSLFRSGAKVLCDVHHALNNLYKQIYIKGLCQNDSISKSSRIIESFRTLDLPLNYDSLTFNFIDNYFAKLGYRPALDSLKLLSANSECLQLIVENEFSKFESRINVLTIFIRSSNDSDWSAVTNSVVEFITKYPPSTYRIYNQGYLNLDESLLIKSETRGGNWFSDLQKGGGILSTISHLLIEIHCLILKNYESTKLMLEKNLTEIFFIQLIQQESQFIITR